MTAAVQETFDIPAPAVLSRDESREAVRVASIWAAGEHKGMVHARFVRPFLPKNVAPAQIGSVFNTLGARGVLVPARRAALKSGGGSGNSNKLLPVWRLTRPITREDVA